MPQRSQRILHDVAARAALLRGMERMTRLLRPTLGPIPRTVAIARLTNNTQPPEILDHAATIARRTLQLADPFEDMGGMLIRHLAWQVFERVGDGSATSAVIAQSLVQAAHQYVAAGGNPVSVRRGLERAAAVAATELRRQARRIDGPEEIARLLAGSLRDPQLADLMGEVLDAVGSYGAILVENAQGTRTTAEYVDGVRWNEGFVSSFLLPEGTTSTLRVLNPRILVTDIALERAEQLLATLEACVAAGERGLMVIAPEVRDSAVGMLVANRERGALEHAIAVRAPTLGAQRNAILEDLSVITGGRFISQQLGDDLTRVRIEDLGKARQAWATKAAFGIVGGEGSKSAIRQRIAAARTELKSVDANDAYTSSKIEERIGKLAGLTAIIRVGAASTSEQEELKLRVEAAIRAARSALQEGVVPGGGAALLACERAVQAIDAQGDERLGAMALARALAEPMRSILRNAGVAPETVVARARACSCVYDVVRQEWVDPWTAGLVDPLAVVLTALEASVSTASIALSADVLIHRKNPPTVTTP